ncbi:hypothetical protein Hanom_Chr08g00708061 [Helianthus anomalus]
MVDGLLSSVSEGLTYVKHVEETLNACDMYLSIQNTTRTLWLEVEVYHKWIGNKLPNPAHQVKATKEIVQWLAKRSCFWNYHQLSLIYWLLVSPTYPRVIATKCHTSVIEKRKASVHVAAQLLGETLQIINSLQDRKLPSLNPDELLFIDKWRDYFLHPSC